MVQTRQRVIFFLALAALLAMFASCKNESPTAPPSVVPPTGTSGTTPPTSGGSTPPSGATVVLTVSNPTPLVDSVTTITATVSLGGQPVANGTAVEFLTNLGTFVDSADLKTIRITTNGVATATLTSPDPGPATVSATVNNVTRTVVVTFTTPPPSPPTPPSTAPTISNVSPNTGLPAGGQTVTINGTNFRAPVRVLFDVGGGTIKEAFVTNVTPTQITVITPRIDLISGQTQAVAVTVIDEAGSPAEQRVTRGAAFTYVLAQLTPVIRALSPTSGPIDGNTLVTIVGDAFDAAGGVQVFFGAAQATVVTVNFSQIVVRSPVARDTSEGGSAAVTGFVDVRVKNIASGKDVTAAKAYRYTPKMAITTFAPGSGSAFGGTRVTIDGTGFNDPLAVSFAGIAAQVIKVSGTEIIAIPGRVPVPCQPPTGPTVVTNTENGDSVSLATGFVYNPESPGIIFVDSPKEPGQSFTVTVLKPGVGIDGTAIIRFTIGSFSIVPSPAVITNGPGPVTFTMNTPLVNLPDVACTVGTTTGTKKGPLALDVVFKNVTTTCTDTLTGGLIVNPPAPNNCVIPPTPGPPVASVNPNTECPNGFGTVTLGSSSARLITVSNTAAAGSQSLTVTATVSGANAAEFVVSPTALNVAPGAANGLNVTFTPAAAGARNATLTLFTNDPTQSVITICLQGTGL